ncbi:MAG: sodium:solute symporter [Alistipes sp.]|nr:sodium:solute symporter [Alistipes sp.]
MSPLAIILTLALYVALLFVVAWRSARNVTAKSFFTGGRSTPRAVAAIAMVGAAMSGVTYISVPGSVATDGFSYLQTCMGFVVGYIIIAYILIPLYFRLGVVSLYEYLDHRFGIVAHRTGAWFFFISKIASASLRAYVICVVLQGLLYDVYDIPFAVNAAVMMSLVWLYTRRGGVRSVVWVEMLKTCIMITSIVLCIAYVVDALNMDISTAVASIRDSRYAEVFFFDNPLDGRYFWKQFLAGIFLVVAMTGLDQDMMQTMLSCRSRRDAQRSMMTSIVIQVAVITLFLTLGALLYMYVDSRNVAITRGDDLFGLVATQCGLPMVVGVAFILGLVASTYSSAGSALTALTTSLTLDILRSDKDGNIEHTRQWVHTLIAAMMTLIIITFHHVSTAGAITLIFTMASYTYGPLLGLFIFGLATRRRPNPRAIPIIALAAPTLSYIVATNSAVWLAGYTFSYDILILNTAITLLGLWLTSRKQMDK